MYKIPLILLFLISSANAASIDYYIILANADQVGIMQVMLNGIHYFVGDTGTGATEYKSLLSLSIVLGTTWILIQMAIASMNGNASAAFKHYVIYLIMLFGLGIIIYGPRSTVMVQTKVYDGTNMSPVSYSVDHDVPMFFAFTLSTFTTLQLELSRMSEEAFNIPTQSDNFVSGGNTGLGFAGGEISLSKIVQNSTFQAEKKDSNISEMYEAFIRDCVILPSAANGGTGLGKYDTDVYNNIKPSATGFGSELVTYAGNTGYCNDFWDGAVGAFAPGFTPLKTVIDNFKSDINASTKLGKLGSSLAYYGAIMDGGTSISNAADVKSAITQSVLSNEYRNVFAKMGVAGDVAASGAAQSQSDMILNGIGTGLFMSTQIPIVAFILFVLMVAATPFLFVFALFPGSGSILINFLKTLLWISLWQPMGSILNVFLDYNFARTLRENSYETVNGIVQMSPQALIDVSSDAAQIAGIAGGMFVMVQGLSWLLVTGSGQMVGNLMASAAQKFQSYSNADNQIAAHSDMQEAALLSDQMGRQVSLREKYATQASHQAALNAGQTAGMMKAHGTGPASSLSIANTTDINSTLANSQQIGNAKSTEANYSDGKGGLSTEKMVKTSSINASSKQGADISSSIVLDNIQNASNVGGNLAEKQAREDTHVSSQYEDLKEKEKNALASDSANTKVANPIKTIQKVATNDKTSLSEAVETMSDTTSTMNAANLVHKESSIKEQNGSNKTVSNYEKTGKLDGARTEADANAIDDVDVKSVAKQEASLKIRAKNEEAKVINDNITKHKNDASNAHNKKLEVQKEITSTQEKLDKQTAETALTQKDENGNAISTVAKLSQQLSKGEISKEDYKNAVSKIALDGKRKQLSEMKDKNSVEADELRKDIRHAEDQLGITKTRQTLAALKSKEASLQKTEDFNRKRAEEAQVKNKGKSDAAKISAETGAGAHVDADKSFETGVMSESKKNEMIDSLIAAGIEPERAGKIIAAYEAGAISGKALNQGLSAERIYKTLSSSEGGSQTLNKVLSKETREHFEKGGDAITDDDRMHMIAAAKGLNELTNEYVNDGRKVQETTDHYGNVKQMKVDGSQTIDVSRNIKYSIMGDLSMAGGVNSNTSRSELALRSVARDVTETVVGVATGGVVKTATKKVADLVGDVEKKVVNTVEKKTLSKPGSVSTKKTGTAGSKFN